VLGLVRKLIDYGKHLADTLQQRAAAPGFARFARPFGSADLAVILTRITNGLRRAAALEARLRRRAARGHDLVPTPIDRPAMRSPRAAREAAPPGARSEPRRAAIMEDPRFARLLTEEEIAAEVRHRPIGAIIVDICHDLGIVPRDLDRAFWDEIQHAISEYGGSLMEFGRKLTVRWFASRIGKAAWPRQRLNWRRPRPARPDKKFNADTGRCTPMHADRSAPHEALMRRGHRLYLRASACICG
jgi:hypothetical protein